MHITRGCIQLWKYHVPVQVMILVRSRMHHLTDDIFHKILGALLLFYIVWNNK